MLYYEKEYHSPAARIQHIEAKAGGKRAGLRSASRSTRNETIRVNRGEKKPLGG